MRSRCTVGMGGGLSFWVRSVALPRDFERERGGACGKLNKATLDAALPNPVRCVATASSATSSVSAEEWCLTASRFGNPVSGAVVLRDWERERGGSGGVVCGAVVA